MRRTIFITIIALLFSAGVFAHTPFTLVSIEKKPMKSVDVARFLKEQNIGKEGRSYLYGQDIRLLP